MSLGLEKESLRRQHLKPSGIFYFMEKHPFMEHSWVSWIPLSVRTSPDLATDIRAYIVTSVLRKSLATWEGWLYGGQSTGKNCVQAEFGIPSRPMGHNWFISCFHYFDLVFPFIFLLDLRRRMWKRSEFGFPVESLVRLILDTVRIESHFWSSFHAELQYSFTIFLL